MLALLQSVRHLDKRAGLLLLILRNEKRPAELARALDLAERLVAGALRFEASQIGTSQSETTAETKTSR